MSKVRRVILKAANEAADRGQVVSAPAAYFRRVPIESLADGALSLEGGIKLNCPAFDQRMAGCTSVVVFVVTLGAPLDAEVSQGFEDGGNPLAPLFLDTAGWLTIEAVTREFTGYLKPLALQGGHQLTIRMAPGYDYRVAGTDERSMWALEEQAGLFKLLDCADLPVELLDSGAMMPRMSRSGMFGLRPV